MRNGIRGFRWRDRERRTFSCHRRYCVFVVNGADVAKAECFDQSLYDFVMRTGWWVAVEGGVGTKASSSRLMVRV